MESGLARSDSRDSRASRQSWVSMKEHVRASVAPSGTSTRRTSARRPLTGIRMPTPLADPSYPYNSPEPSTSGRFDQDTAQSYGPEYPFNGHVGATYYDPQREYYDEVNAVDPYRGRRESEGSVDGYGGHGTEITDRLEIDHDELDLSHRSPQPDRFNKKRRFGGGLKLLKSFPKILGRKKSSKLPIEQRQSLINEPKYPLANDRPSRPHIRVTQHQGSSLAGTHTNTILIPPPSAVGPSEDHIARSHYLSSRVGRSTSQRSQQTRGSSLSRTASGRSGHTRDGDTSIGHHNHRSNSGSHQTSQSSTLPSNQGPSVPPPSIEKNNDVSQDDASVITSPQMHLVQIAKALRDFHHMPWHDPHHTTTVYVPEISGRSKNRTRLLQQTSKEVIVKELDRDGPSWYRPSVDQRRKLASKGKWPPPSKEPDVPLFLRGRATAAGIQPSPMPNYNRPSPYLTGQQSQSRTLPPMPRGVDSVPSMPAVPVYFQGYPPYGPMFYPFHPSYMSGSTNMSGQSASTGMFPVGPAQDAQPAPHTPSVQSHATVRPNGSSGGHSTRTAHPQTPVMAHTIPSGLGSMQSPPGFVPPLSPYPYPPINMGPNGLPLGFVPGMPQPMSPHPAP